MLFNSYIFILFFLPVVLAGYFVLNHFKLVKLAQTELLVMSLLFYGYYNPYYLLIISISIIINFLLSRLIIRYESLTKKFILVAAVLGNIGVLFYFKYFDFLLENVNILFQSKFELRNILLPLGISFFTFQQISFIVDTYKGETDGYNFLEYAVFVAFFPQLVAGPIVLHKEIIPQFRDEGRRVLNYDYLSRGIIFFAVGLFKKVILADTFGLAVNYGFANLDALSSIDCLLVMLFYTFQIYFDFSGYCDMATGIANMFNINLPVNFNAPYTSLSIVEFWERWHMSLTRFLREYIYFPLGGSRRGRVRTCLNILMVFLISGIWHGANWTFILWGMLHGAANVLTRLSGKLWNKIHIIFRWFFTFLFVNLTWVIFRADSIGEAGKFFGRLMKFDGIRYSREIVDYFVLPEFLLISEIFHLQFLLDPTFYMILFAGAAFLIVLFVKPLTAKVIKINIIQTISVVVMLVWSIFSLSGVSTFLYFGF